MTIFALFVAIVFWSIHLSIYSPISEYLFYFTGLCHNPSVDIADDKIVFSLKDEKGTPLGCKKVRIEQESGHCVFSTDCPDFNTIKRFTTSKDGSLILPKKIFNDRMRTYVDGPPGEEFSSTDKKFLFHGEGNYNSIITLEDISSNSKEGELIPLSLTKKSTEFCSGRFKNNYCDGY